MVGGFVVVCMDKDGEISVRFCYVLEEANAIRCDAIEQGYTAKIFKV